MYKLELVRAKIDVLNGGEFQALAQRYVYKKYGLDNPSYYGTSSGTTKPAKGAFDSFYRTRIGDWVALSCGHYPKDRKRAKKKILEDLVKVREEEAREGITLSTIICCHSCSRLTIEDIEEVKAEDGRTEIIGPDKMAEDICEKYFFLADQYLGLDLSGTILDMETFLKLKENDAFETSLSTELRGRESELEHLLVQIKENQAVILSGRSGCGKTRLAIEAATRYADQCKEVDLYCIKAGRSLLGKELATYFSRPDDILILVDDVNELADITSLVDHVLLHPNIRLLMTVRNYALSDLNEEIKRIKKMVEISIEQLDNSIINEILVKSYNMHNSTTNNALIGMAKGNLRIVCLAAERLQSEDLEFVSYKELLDICYGKKLNEMTGAIQKAGEISAILGPHKTEHNRDLTKLESLYGLTHTVYIEACAQLFDQELLDMRQNYAAVSLEEQNLRDYFMYRAISSSKNIDLTILWSLENGRSICKRVVNTLFGVFSDGVLKDRAASFANEIWPKLQDQERNDFLIQYGIFLGIEGLLYLRQQIKEIPIIAPNCSKRKASDSVKSYVNNDIASAISVYLRGADYREALQLMFEYMDRGGIKLKEAKRFFSSTVILSPDSSICSYEDRLFILDHLSARCGADKNGFNLFCLEAYVEAIWNDEFVGEAKKENMTSIIHGNMSASLKELIQLRKICAEKLSSINPQRARSVILSYSRSYSRFGKSIETRRETYLLIDELIQPYKDWSLQEVINGTRIMQRADRQHVMMNNLTEKLRASWGITVVYRFLQSEKTGTEIIAIAKEANEDNIKDLIKLLARGEWPSCQGAWSLQCNLRDLFFAIATSDEMKANLFCDLYLEAGLPANQIAFAVSDFLLVQKGYRATKSLLVDAPLSDLGNWLSYLDKVSLKDDKFEASLDEILHCVREYGERFLPEQALLLEELHSGFYLEYLSFLLSSKQNENAEYFANIPEKDIRSYRVLFQKSPDLALLFGKIFVYAVKHGSWVNFDGFAQLVASFDLEFSGNVFTVVCYSDCSSELQKELFSFIWRQKNCKNVITKIVDMLLEEDAQKYGEWMSLGRMFNNSPEAKLDDFVIVQSLRVLKVKGLYGFIDVACCLKSSLKRLLFLELARNGAEWQVLEKVLLTPYGHYEQWEKSYIPLIDERIQYIKEIKDLLNESGIEQYDFDILELIDRQNKEKSRIQLDEFVDPFCRPEI